jgi:hypothetical protein
MQEPPGLCEKLQPRVIQNVQIFSAGSKASSLELDKGLQEKDGRSQWLVVGLTCFNLEFGF